MNEDYLHDALYDDQEDVRDMLEQIAHMNTDYAALEARCAGLERERDEWERRYHALNHSHQVAALQAVDIEHANVRLKQERDALRAKHLDVVEKVRKESKWWMDECDKVSTRMHEIAAEREALQDKLAAVEEALKPSAETKAEYMGEFSWKEASLDEYEEPCLRTIYVPWTTIKEIMRAIKARATLADTTTGEVQP